MTSDHLGCAPVEPLGLVVVAGELHLVAGATLLLGLGEGIGIGGAAVAVGPGERLTFGVEQADGAALGVDRLDAVAGVATRRAVLPTLAEDDDGARAVAGGAGARGVGEADRFAYGDGHGAFAQRAVADQLGADGVGERLATLAGRIEGERAGAIPGRQAHEVAGEPHAAHVVVGVADDLATPVVEGGERGLGVADEQRLDCAPGVWVGLADDFGEFGRLHAGVLQLSEGAAGRDATQLLHVTDQHDACVLGVGLGEQRLAVAGAEHWRLRRRSRFRASCRRTVCRDWR